MSSAVAEIQQDLQKELRSRGGGDTDAHFDEAEVGDRAHEKDCPRKRFGGRPEASFCLRVVCFRICCERSFRQRAQERQVEESTPAPAVAVMMTRSGDAVKNKIAVKAEIGRVDPHVS